MRSPLNDLRVAVVGGSLGGLTAAALLRDAGCQVDVFERSEVPLSGFGAGIVVQEATVRYLTSRLGITLEDISVPSRVLQYLGPYGEVAFQRPSPYRFTAWNTVFRALAGSFPDPSYHLGCTFVSAEQDPDGVDVRFDDGSKVRVDLLICADGVMSTARASLAPDVGPRYSGYVGWRGTVSETLLSSSSFEILSDAITYALVPNSHIVAYQIPSLAGGLGEGERLVNFVWYRNVADGEALDDLMTDTAGVRRPLSLHPGIVQERHVDEIRHTASEVLPGPLAEMVVRTPEPFVQAIVDVESRRMAFGRICLIGDAAFTARPHAAAGSAKAAEDGWTLVEALRVCGGDVPAALDAWEPGALTLGRQLVARARGVGERSQFHGTWVPGDPDLQFGLYGPGR